MLWVLPGALGIPLSEGAWLSPAQKAFVVGLPILPGSLLRAPAGLLADRLGGARLLSLLLFPIAVAYELLSRLPALPVTVLLLGVVVVDDRLRTSDESVFAIGEVALHAGTTYGLVGPGYEMADVLAKNLAGAGDALT